MSGSNALQITDPNADNPLAQAPSWADAAQSVGGTVSSGVDALGQWLAAQRAKSNQRAPVWPMSNPVGTETTQSMGQATPINPIAFMRPDGTPVMGSDMAAAHQAVQNALQVAPTMALGMVGDAPGIRAFHGSPYDFERFDTSKIGTGEGNQSFGRGLYFAEQEGTARTYRDTGVAARGNDYSTSTGGRIPDWMGDRLNAHVPGGANYQATIDSHLGDFQQRLAEEQAALNTAPDPWNVQDRVSNLQGIIKSLQELKSGDATLQPRGRMYEVNIGADPEQFLHWDKPLSEQSQYVQDAIKQHRGMAGFFEQNPNATGEQLYRYKTNPTGGGLPEPAGAAETLRQFGIPGIRYLDQGSRGAGSGTHNYVVFDANTIDILRKYGLAGLGIGLSGAAAGTQGQPQQ